MPNLINQIQIGNTTYDIGYPLVEGGGTTDATAKTSTWTGSCDGITSYYDGLTIRYKVGVAGQTTTTLNINGLGAKRIYRFNTTSLTTQFPVGSIINLVYHADLNDGCWMCNDYDANTTYTNASLGQGIGACTTATATAAKAVTLSSYSLTTGGIVAVRFTNAVPANATMNINGKGAKSIYYKGNSIVDGVINAGEVATFIYDGTRYHLLTVDRNRFFTSLVPYGTQITASSSATVDLNSPTYLKVGNYFCSANAQAEFISNLPKAKTAFMMQVYSPLSQTVDNETGTWVYRLRKIIFYTGEEYTQYCYTNGTGGNWTYGPWLQFITSNKTATTTANGLMSAADKEKLDGIGDVIDGKIATAITTALNTEV